MPDFELENACNIPVCGLDEVGRAPLAGSVVAACVYIPDPEMGRDLWRTVNDSKALSAQKRIKLAAEIRQYALWGIGEACPREIETHNIVQASFLAMRRAYISLSSLRKQGSCNQKQPDPVFQRDDKVLALIDGNITPKNFPCSVQTVIKGDSKSVSIAAASIIAKVHRDEMMMRLSEAHPHYGWERNAGYPTREHMEGIEAYGITDHHRRNFAPVANYVQFGTTKRQIAMAL